MKAIVAVSTALAVTALSGCLISNQGSSLSSSPYRPGGLMVRVVSGDLEFAGELLEVRTADVLLLTNLRVAVRSGTRSTVQEHHIRRLSLADIRSISIEQAGASGRNVWSAGDSGAADELRLVSRFPQGLTPEVLDRLLESYGLTAVEGNR